MSFIGNITEMSPVAHDC